MKRGIWQRSKRLVALLAIPAPDRRQFLERIQTMERDLVLPAKVIVFIILIASFYLFRGTGTLLNSVEVAAEMARNGFAIYVVFNLAVAVLLFNLNRLPAALLKWTVFTVCLVDGIALAGITVLTLDSATILYWLLFLILIVRNSITLPQGMPQLVLNFTIGLLYLIAAECEKRIFDSLSLNARTDLDLLGHTSLSIELMLLRFSSLWLMAFCCYGVQALLERQRRATDEAREFAMRESQLRAAGRLAAEFAHQIKNPLAIINNAAFTLQRALKNAKPEALKPVEIIQEEVAHADQIITQVMGYAQLSEGRVENLDVLDELNRAIEQVFPPAVLSDVKVQRQFTGTFPPLLMQRRHLGDTLVNVLQNAREALNGNGNVRVTAKCLRDYSVEITITDDGPGIPPDKQEKIFEAYYTTKERGTGLGLAMVKHNVELYGGDVRVESELGKGATFVLIFPARTLPKLAGQS